MASSTIETVEEFNSTLLESIKNFVDDLSTVTTSQSFVDYHTIVKRIDETKLKSYGKLVKGFRTFFEANSEPLSDGDFDALKQPNISFITDNGSIEFNFQQTFQDAEEVDQDIIKDHLNHIWNILNNAEKSPEEIYIDKIFADLKSRFSSDMTREEQMMVAKNLFSDFQRQNLDISVVVKVACSKARNLLLSNGSDDHSKTLMLIDAVEEIDVNHFDMIQFMGLIGKVGTLFSDGETNPLNNVLSTIFTENNLSLPFPIEVPLGELGELDEFENLSLEQEKESNEEEQP
jgi:hypothetical protein